MKRSLFLSPLTAAFLLAPVLCLAQPQDAPMARPNPRRGADPQFHAQGRNQMEGRTDTKAELGLTEAQQADVRKNMEATRRARLLKSTDLKVASMDLRSMLRAEKVDEKALAAKLAEVQAAQGAILKLKVDSALAMKQILTPEQQQRMSAMRRGQGRARLHRRMTSPGSPRSGRGRMGQGRMTRPGPRGMGSPGNDPDFDLDPDLDRDDFDFDGDDDFEEIHQDIREDIRL